MFIDISTKRMSTVGLHQNHKCPQLMSVSLTYPSRNKRKFAQAVKSLFCQRVNFKSVMPCINCFAEW